MPNSKPMTLDGEEREALVQKAREMIQMTAQSGDVVQCPSCNAPARRHRVGRCWEINCACGWSAAGADKQQAN